MTGPDPVWLLRTLLLWAVLILVACSDSLWDPPIPGAVIAERSSPDQSLLARVVAADLQGSYTLGIHDVRNGRVVAERIVAAPVGYHPHLVSLRWSEDGRTLTVVIDHDFGDYSSVFELHLEHKDG